ncbi:MULTISPECIES: hypothetical protein [Alphaproteobacteria]|uniref:hypothetical protein n=1 Tax=Alphaproteobacteria TaxID=28211 RepID=UPI0032983E84
MALTAKRILICCAMLLSASSCARPADDVYYVCISDSSGFQESIRQIQMLADEFGLNYQDFGGQIRRDLDVIDANQVVIPDGVPVHATVEERSGKVVLLVSNFGNGQEDIRLSFFFFGGDHSEDSFPQSVLSRMRNISGVQIVDSEAALDGLCSH